MDMSGKVKAAILKGVRELKIVRYDKPEVSSDALLMRTEICGVCGTDVHLYEGRMKVPYPIIPGHEFVGKIEEIGEKAGTLEVRGLTLAEGDSITVVPGTNLFCGKCFYCRFMPHRPTLCENRRVYGITMSSKDPPHLFGGWAEYVYVDPVHFWVYKLPEDIPPEVAVLIEPMAVASRAFERAFEPGMPSTREGFGPGRSVVVQGAGPIGLLTIAVAKIAGAGKVIAIDVVDERLKMAQKFGADYAIHMKEIDKPEKRVEEVKRLTYGLGADAVFECAGVPAAFAEGMEMTRNGGKYVEVGHYTDPGGVEIHPHRICRKDMDILGSWAYPPTQFETAITLLHLNSNTIPFRELVTHKFKIEEAEKAIRHIQKREGLKMAIKP